MMVKRIFNATVFVPAIFAFASTMLAAESESSAFLKKENENASVDIRGVVDSKGVYSGNNGPTELYPESSEGLSVSTFRLLLDSTFWKKLKISLNAYQNISADTVIPSMINTDYSDYRSVYLQHTWGSGKISGSLVLDVFTVGVELGTVGIKLGRQPVVLATYCTVFTPNDIFYPFPTGSPDTAFRPGVDAGRIDWRFSDQWKLILVGVLGYDQGNHPTWNESAALATLVLNIDDSEFSFIGGKDDDRYFFGGGLSANIKSFGLTFEGNASFPEANPSNGYVEIVTGANYKWRNSLQLILEYHYHGNGTMNPANYYNRLKTMDQMYDNFVGIHYLGLVLQGNVLPVLKLMGTAAVNLIDPSAEIIPAIVYNPADKIDLMLYGTIPIGRSAFMPSGGSEPEFRSEFGAYQYSATLLARIYF